MSTPTVDAELVEELIKRNAVPETTALVPKTGTIESLVKPADLPVFQAMQGMDTLDWKNLKPNQTAVLLMQRPMAVSGGGVMFLNFKQALYFAVRAFELGVSPFSSGIWFDPQRYSVNLTLEGKREVARNRNIDLGPPSFEEMTREWKDVPKMTDTGEDAKKAGFTKDLGIKCRMRVGDPKHAEHVEYLAWISEWFQPKSPLWKSKPTHMLQIRANEKAVTMCLGTGVSAMPDEKDIE